jgi:hypothetical protein
MKTNTTTTPADYKTLQVKYDKHDRLYRAYDESGNEYTESDCPRQIMMELADKHGQELYYRGKNWRRRKPIAVATPAVQVSIVDEIKDPAIVS